MGCWAVPRKVWRHFPASLPLSQSNSIPSNVAWIDLLLINTFKPSPAVSEFTSGQFSLSRFDRPYFYLLFNSITFLVKTVFNKELVLSWGSWANQKSKLNERTKEERRGGGGLKETVSNGSFGFLQAGDMFREMEAVGGKCKSQTHHCPSVQPLQPQSICTKYVSPNCCTLHVEPDKLQVATSKNTRPCMCSPK